jgi:hypothetical protein
MILLALTRLTLLITLVFALMIAGLRAQPYDDPIQGYFSGCAISCWQGVEPGRSIGTASLHRLNAEYDSQPTISGCINLPSNFCTRFSWRSADSERSTEVLINHDRIQSITVYPPQFTLGEALLALGSFHAGFYGASQASVQKQRFYVQLLFDETRIGLSMTVTCPAPYFVLMQTAVSSMNVGTPTSNTQQYFLNNFAAVRRRWYQLCQP